MNPFPTGIWPPGWRFEPESGELLDAAGRPQAILTQDVLDFTQGEQFWPAAHLRRLDQEQWLRRNWLGEGARVQSDALYRQFCQRICAASGPWLELAAGPGGGNLAPLLHLRPELPLIVNDLEPRLLQRWSALLAGALPEHQVSFAAFDLTCMPLAEASIGCISSVAGLGSIRGDPQTALAECARVLRPGGLLAAVELTLALDTANSLPAQLAELWANSPWLLRRWPQSVRSAGLTLVAAQAAKVELGPDAGLWQDAQQFGVNLAVERHYLLFRK